MPRFGNISQAPGWPTIPRASLRSQQWSHSICLSPARAPIRGAANGQGKAALSGTTEPGMQPYSAYFAPVERAGDLVASRNLLALIEFAESGGGGDSDPRRLTVGLPQLGPSPLLEVWESATPVES